MRRPLLLAACLLTLAVQPPTVVAHGDYEPPPPAQGCRTFSYQMATLQLELPSIETWCPVYWPAPGGEQAMLDAHAVAMMGTHQYPVVKQDPFYNGTLWIAAHRTTYGASFSRLPEIPLDALIRVDGWTSDWSRRTVAIYWVVRKGIYPDNNHNAIWLDGVMDRPAITLQTSWTPGYRYLVHGLLLERWVA